LPELLETEERINAMFRDAKSGTAGTTNAGRPRNGDKR
jgi:hypothetical protein